MANKGRPKKEYPRNYFTGFRMDRDEFLVIASACWIMQHREPLGKWTVAGMMRHAAILEAERICRKYGKTYPEFDAIKQRLAEEYEKRAAKMEKAQESSQKG